MMGSRNTQREGNVYLILILNHHLNLFAVSSDPEPAKELSSFASIRKNTLAGFLYKVGNLEMAPGGAM